MDKNGENFHYISQSKEFYKVTSEDGKELTVAKASFGQQDDAVSHHDFHQKWLHYAALGLALGGIVTVLFSPLVISQNVRLLRKAGLNKTERIHAKNLIITATILFVLGVIFFSLFIMHLLF